MSGIPAGAPERQVILCADDYAISAGVSRGILELARQGRISATSALVTYDRWPDDARPLAAVRDRIAIGLHVNLTLGKPLGAMRSLAPDGEFPSLRALVSRALIGRIDTGEVAAEIARQLARFEAETGFPPDHVDGHQHVHTLPRVREGVLSALTARFPSGGPLVRDPTDWGAALRTPGVASVKGIMISLLSAGFRSAARAKGFAINTTFSGVSSFDRNRPYATELAAALRAGGACHLVMCHPGYADPELAAADPVVERREDELAAIKDGAAAVSRLWHPKRAAAGPSIVWSLG